MKRSGFSLLEALVAFAILTLVLGVLLPTNDILLERSRDGAQQFLAHDFALSQLAKLGVSDPLPSQEQRQTYGTWLTVVRVDRSDIQISITVEIWEEDRQLAKVIRMRPAI